MSSILPFVLVAVSLVVVVVVALATADQPATDGAPVRRDPLIDRVRPLWQWLRRSLRESWTWFATAVAGFRTRRSEARAARRQRREAQAAAEAEERARAAEAPSEPVAYSQTAIVAPPPEKDGVVTTALRVRDDPAVGEAVGEDLPRARPGLFVRLKSAVGLLALIAALGLGLAAVLTAVVTLVSAALDGFVG
ncbi:MAG: hypothetical protein AAGK32_00270 [Actinomycetota bacterium]